MNKFVFSGCYFCSVIKIIVNNEKRERMDIINKKNHNMIILDHLLRIDRK